ncbi:hypothetical protein Gotri_013749, partial [Gossypium trilobum]|nr:hypothetical protein [Gossypium trilobum]
VGAQCSYTGGKRVLPKNSRIIESENNEVLGSQENIELMGEGVMQKEQECLSGIKEAEKLSDCTEKKGQNPIYDKKFKVAELIDSSSRIWKKELIASTFLEDVAEKIISIPLEEEPHEDYQAWSVEASGEYTVCSAYKLIQGIEDNPKGLASQCRIFCCALWVIWGDRNDKVHKKWSKSGKEIGRFVNSYISELNKIDKNRPQISITVSKWRKPPDRVVKINFDAAYDGRSNKLAVGIVARDSEGTVLLSCSEIHQGVASAFAAEALACRKVTQIGIDVQWEKVIIE